MDRETARTGLDEAFRNISQIERSQREAKMLRYKAQTVERNAEGFLVAKPVREFTVSPLTTPLDQLRNRYIQLQALRALRKC